MLYSVEKKTNNGVSGGRKLQGTELCTVKNNEAQTNRGQPMFHVELLLALSLQITNFCDRTASQYAQLQANNL